MRVDLHTHSHFSDGQQSPADLVTYAAQLQIDLLALTDHDTLAGLHEAQTTAAQLSVRLISGIELSAQWAMPKRLGQPPKPVGIHVIGLGMTDLAPLQQVLLQQQAVRAQRARDICDRLQQWLNQDFYPDILALAGGRPKAITRSHIAQVLVMAGVITRPQQAFDLYLGEGKRAHVPLNWLALHEAIKVILASGGRAVLAHPTRYMLSSTLLRQLVTEFKALGGHALELPSCQETASKRTMLDLLIKQHQLQVSVGSDFHGKHMPWLRLGQVPLLKPEQVPVWADF